MRLVLWTWGSSSATATYTFWMFRDDSKKLLGFAGKRSLVVGVPTKRAFQNVGV